MPITQEHDDAIKDHVNNTLTPAEVKSLKEVAAEHEKSKHPTYAKKLEDVGTTAYVAYGLSKTGVEIATTIAKVIKHVKARAV